jgi:hypothetical protein
MWFINPGAKLMLFHKTHFVICTQKFAVCFILHKKALLRAWQLL